MSDFTFRSTPPFLPHWIHQSNLVLSKDTNAPSVHAGAGEVFFKWLTNLSILRNSIPWENTNSVSRSESILEFNGSIRLAADQDHTKDLSYSLAKPMGHLSTYWLYQVNIKPRCTLDMCYSFVYRRSLQTVQCLVDTSSL